MDRIEYTDNRRKKKNSPALFIILIILAFLIGAGIMYVYGLKNPKIVTKNRTLSETKVTEEAMEDAISKVYDSVICIEIVSEDGTVKSSGTGFVYDKDDKYGYVLTNAHVVSGATTVNGTLSNNKTIELTVLGTDTYMDLAVLKMDVNEVLQVASIGKSSNIKIGNTVFTVGSPMGSDYAGTVTKGILSGKDRLLETNSQNTNSLSTESFIVKVIQTDAAISPGNSGGPLVDLAGDVIGITSLKLVDNQVEGMGFAIPIEDAMNYVDILKAGKQIERPLLGVQILDLTNKFLLYRYGIDVDSSIKSGVILVKITDNYPASNGGLKEGDIVTKIDGQKVTTVAEFKYELYKHNIGDKIEVTYYRDKKENKVTLKLDKSN